jgi:redox-sensitive bicupin YhaK (pirin superfamily)
LALKGAQVHRIANFKETNLCTTGVMAVARSGSAITLLAREDSRVMVAGSVPVGKRHILWNFVSSSRERKEHAKTNWRAGRFESAPGDDEFIPLPD